MTFIEYDCDDGTIIGTQKYICINNSSIQYGGDIGSLFSGLSSGFKQYVLPTIKQIAKDPQTQRIVKGLINKGVSAGADALSQKLNLDKQLSKDIQQFATRGSNKLTSLGQQKLNQLLGNGLHDLPNSALNKLSPLAREKLNKLLGGNIGGSISPAALRTLNELLNYGQNINYGSNINYGRGIRYLQ